MLLELFNFVGGALLVILDLLQFARNPRDKSRDEYEDSSRFSNVYGGIPSELAEERSHRGQGSDCDRSDGRMVQHGVY